MKLIHGKINDIERIMEIIDEAKDYLKSKGSEQWQYGYPNLEIIQEDIENKDGYIFVKDDEILGYLYLGQDGDSDYDEINGAWALDKEFTVIHRMAFGDNARGKGLSKRAFQLIEELSLELGFNYIRVDTAEENQDMLSALKKANYIKRGIVQVHGRERIGFDKIL